MNKGIYFDGNLEFRRERTLGTAETQPVDKLPSRRDELEDLANSVFAKFENASDKANILMKYTAEVAKKYTIPVPEESFELRAAITRFDNSDGSFVTFETYQNCIALIESIATNVDFKVIDTTVTADPLANERRIKKELDTRFKSDDQGFLVLMLVASQIGVLYLIHEICGLWRGPEHVLANSTDPQDQPGAFSEAMRQVAISMAVGAALLGINNAISFLFASQGTKKDEKLTTIIEGAIGQASQVELPPLVEVVKKAMSAEDYRIIFEYCLRYISSSKDRGYEFWLAYYSARKIRYLSARNRSLGPMFSRKLYAENNGIRSVDSALVNPEDIVLRSPNMNLNDMSPAGELALVLADAINSSVVTPNIEYLCTLEYESNAFVNGLARIAQILDTKLAQDVMCCFIRFFGGLDMDLLRKIRAILQAFLNFHLYDLTRMLENFESFIASWIEETILRLIYSLVQAIIDKLIRMVIDFITDLVGDLDFVLECPIILELIQGIIDAIIMIAEDLEEIIKNYLAALVYNLMTLIGLDDLNHGPNSNSSLYIIYKKRRIYEIVKILDAIIAAVESAHILCDEPDPDNPLKVSYTQVVESPVLADLNDYLNIPEPVRRQYFPEGTEVMLEDGTYIPDYSDNVVRIGRKVDTSVRPPVQEGESYHGCIDQMDHILPKDVLKKFSNGQSNI
jgi:hypothetical protein